MPCFLPSDFPHWKNLEIPRFHSGMESGAPSSTLPTATSLLPCLLQPSSCLTALLLLAQTKLKSLVRRGDLQMHMCLPQHSSPRSGVQLALPGASSARSVGLCPTPYLQSVLFTTR